MPIVALTGFSPGVGRSTLTAALAETFAAQNFRALILDADGDGGAGKLLHQDPGLFGLFDAIVGSGDLEDAIVSVDERIDYVPAGVNVDALDRLLDDEDFDLKGAVEAILDPVVERYDLVVIDTSSDRSAPGTLLALTAADVVVTLVPPGSYGKLPAPEEVADIEIARELNPGLAYAGCVQVDKQIAGNGMSSVLSEVLRRLKPYISNN